MFLKNADGRLWEIDLFRGIAIIFMIVFHFMYDLNHFSITNMRLYSGYMLYIAYITAAIFVILVGISLTLSYSKVKIKLSKNKIRLRLFKRGSKILSLGMIISIITLIYIPDRFIIFGILHFIGISIILSIPFIHFQKTNIILGFILILCGIYLRTMTFNFNWLIPLGFLPHRFSTIDYFPILPWFGIALIGMAIGNIFYPNGNRLYNFRDRSSNRIIKILCFLGRHSLIIYFLHQPILVLLIFILLI